MLETSFQQLIENAALLLITTLLFDLVKTNWRGNLFVVQKILVSLILSFIGIMLMLNPWTFAPGIIFDTRSILLSISGLFFGLIPTIIAMLSTAAFRIYQGGTAAWTGVSVIVATGTIGLIWRLIRNNKIDQISWLELYLFGMFNSVVMLLLMFTLPIETALNILSEISFPVLLIYPIATMILGYLLVNRGHREKIYQDLQEREGQLSLAVQAAKIGFFDRDLINGTAHISKEWKSQLGYGENEIPDDDLEWESRLHPEEKEKTLKFIEDMIAGNENYYELNFRLRHKDGSYRWILSRALIRRDNRGKAIQIIDCHVDITQQKEIEQALRNNERKFRSLAENSPDIITLFDNQIKNIYINRTGIERLGLEGTNITGKYLNEIFTDNLLVRNLERDFQQVFDSMKPLQRIGTLTQEEGKNKDFKVVYDWRLTPVFNSENQVDWVLGIARDITSNLETESALRKSEEKFRRIFETSGLGISITDLSGNFISGNPAIETMLGYNLDEYCQMTIADITHPEDVPLNMKMLAEYKSDLRDSFIIEKRLKRKDGKTIWGKLISTLVRDEFGKPLYTIGMMEDITEQKKATEKEKAVQMEMQNLLDTGDQSRKTLLSVIEDQRITEEELKRLTQDLLVAYDSTLEGWSNALELREQETAGHSRRVVDLTLKVAIKFGIEGDDLANLERGALLHDIGKMGIPDSVLLKSGPLTDEEWKIMRMHPIYAYNMLSRIDFLKKAIDIPYSHHERWNGSGYPQGLSGIDIPLAARIFAVVDIWDALGSDRPYRNAWPKEKVIAYIKEISGSQLDPEVVEVFIQLINSNGNLSEENQ